MNAPQGEHTPGDTRRIETDYLVIGAGATGMAFVDELISLSDVEVVMVDRRHRPGGHWNDAYPFVRLHQPSASYGVSSLRLGNDRIDESGPNAGYYERATAPEVCAYYQRVLDERLLPSGKVRFFGMCEYVAGNSGEHRLVSRLTGDEMQVHVRRKVVDATYIEGTVPSTHTPSFSVDPDARLLSPNDLVDLDTSPSGYTILGGGKTGMDTCSWLMDNGVEPDRIRWVRPRESWVFDRSQMQPLDLVPGFFESLSHQVECIAQAEDTADLFRRLEDSGQLHRLDDRVEPSMCRGAILSAAERESLRRIEQVIRLGRVKHVGSRELVLDEGSIPTTAGEVHVDCTATGFGMRPGRPVFEPDRIVVQALQLIIPLSGAVTAYVESTRDDDQEKNRLCQTGSLTDTALDAMLFTFAALNNDALWSAEPDIQKWLEGCRLNPARGAGEHLDDPRMQSSLERLGRHREEAMQSALRLISESMSSPAATA